MIVEVGVFCPSCQHCRALDKQTAPGREVRACGRAARTAGLDLEELVKVGGRCAQEIWALL